MKGEISLKLLRCPPVDPLKPVPFLGPTAHSINMHITNYFRMTSIGGSIIGMVGRKDALSFDDGLFIDRRGLVNSKALKCLR